MKIDEKVNSTQMTNVRPARDACLDLGGTDRPQALVELGNQYKLTHKKRINRAMTLEDLKRQIDTTLRTTEKTFRVGESRILAVLFLLLLAPQGSRTSSILELRFGNLEVLLVKDPSMPDGPPKLLIRLNLEYTKKYLGPKAAYVTGIQTGPQILIPNRNTFLIPEILYDPSMLLSPHIFLLAILFKHRVFKAEALNNDPNILSTLKVPDDCFQLPLGFKDDVKEHYVSFGDFLRHTDANSSTGVSPSDQDHPGLQNFQQAHYVQHYEVLGETDRHAVRV